MYVRLLHREKATVHSYARELPTIVFRVRRKPAAAHLVCAINLFAAQLAFQTSQPHSACAVKRPCWFPSDGPGTPRSALHQSQGCRKQACTTVRGVLRLLFA